MIQLRYIYRSACGCAEIILRKRWTPLSRAVGEEIIGVELAIPYQVERNHVKIVRPRFDCGVYNRRASAVLCRERAALYVEFLNRIHGRANARVAESRIARLDPV